MPADAAVLTLLDAYAAQVAAVRARVLQFVTASWSGLGSWRDDDIDRFVAAVVPRVTAGQQSVATLTDAYLANYESLLFGARVAPLGISRGVVAEQALRGVTATEVYSRMGPEVWRALSGGYSIDVAVQKGLNRLQKTALTDLQLAKTHTVRVVLSEKPDADGYRRVLEGARSCGLCIVASTRRYHSDDLMPIHPGCDCSVAPIYNGGEDPGPFLNSDKVDDVHARIQERFGSISTKARSIPGQTLPGTDEALQYRDVLITHEHGEIGPVLGIRGQKFTSESDF